MPAQPQALSLALRACGAVSVPRKNFGLPEVAARRRLSRWRSRLSTGRQYRCGRLPPSNSALRLIAKRSAERRVGQECVIRVDLGGRRIIKTKKNITTANQKKNNA